MKSRLMAILFCAIGIGLIAVISANGGLKVLYAIPDDLQDALCDYYVDTAPDTAKAVPQYEIDPNCNSSDYDMTPIITAEPQPSRLTIPDR